MKPSQRKHNKGFTLLELIVVLVIMVLGFSMVGLNVSNGNDATALKVAARDIVSALRFARGDALISHQEMTVTLNLVKKTYTVSRREKEYVIPKTINLKVVTAKSQIQDNELASFRFFPDGSATGGRVTLSKGKAAWQIDINWLTGQIELDETDSQP